MADRSYGTITIYGTLATVDQLEALITAIDNQGCEFLHGGNIDREDILTQLLENEPLAFSDTELPGGELEYITTYCEEFNLPFVAQWDACGGAYDTGMRSWHPEYGETLAGYAEGSGATVSIHRVAQAHAEGTLDQLIETYKRAEGHGFPPFAISDEVRAFITQELNPDD